MILRPSSLETVSTDKDYKGSGTSELSTHFCIAEGVSQASTYSVLLFSLSNDFSHLVHLSMTRRVM